MDFTVMSGDARMARVHVLEALLPFGLTLAVAGVLIWLMLYAHLGDIVFVRRVRLPLILLSGVAWGVIQHWRGGGIAGSAVLGIEAALIALLAAAAVARGLRAWRERA